MPLVAQRAKKVLYAPTFISGATEVDSLDESVIPLAKVLVRNVESAFDRLDREVSFRDQ